MIECYPKQYEMTIITFRGETQEAGVYTSAPEVARLLERMCEEYPQSAQVTQIKTTIPRGNRLPKVESMRFKLDKSIIQFDAQKGKPIFGKPTAPKVNTPMPEEEKPEEEQDAPEEDDDDRTPFDYDDEEENCA